MTRDEVIRAFVAVWPSQEITSLLSKVIADLRGELPGYRWVEAQNLHITLEFLGDVRTALISLIGQVLDETASNLSPFEIAIGKPGVFGSPGRARVLWLDVSDPREDLLRLALNVIEKLKRVGFSPDKDFVAHLTLARKKDREGGFISRERWQDLWYARFKEVDASNAGLGKAGNTGAWTVSCVTLVKSVLTANGPHYEVIHESRLGPVVR